MKRFLCFLYIIISVCLVGCKNKPSIPEGKSVVLTGSATVMDFIPPQNEYSSVTQCPVSGDRFKITKDTKAVKYKDRVYYLCCPACILEFKSNPEKYAK